MDTYDRTSEQKQTRVKKLIEAIAEGRNPGEEQKKLNEIERAEEIERRKKENGITSIRPISPMPWVPWFAPWHGTIPEPTQYWRVTAGKTWISDSTAA